MKEFVAFERQKQLGDSPWTLRQRFAIACWLFCWTAFCSWTPKSLNAWRIFILKLFGARIHGRPFVHSAVRINIPWNLTLHDGACLGDGANAYLLGEIEIMEIATVAQEAYLCTGTHAFNLPSQKLIVDKITIGEGAFIGARAFLMPGVQIGKKAIVGACAVVTKDVEGYDIVAGNPAKSIKQNCA